MCAGFFRRAPALRISPSRLRVSTRVWTTTLSSRVTAVRATGWNRAFRSMGGDIIGYLNSDDVLADGAAEAVLETFEQYPEVDLVYGEVEWIDENGIITGRHRGDISTVTEMLDIYNVWWADRQWVQPEVFWRRSLWERVGDFSSEYDLAFDYQYWVRCFLAGIKVCGSR